MIQSMSARSAAAILVILACSWAAWGMDYVTVRRDGAETKLEGRVTVEAQDGGLVLLARDGVLSVVQPAEIAAHTSDNLPFQPFTAAELSQRLLGQLPQGFRDYRTAHYLILYNTSPEYAAWCGSLFERLYMAFTNYWSRRGLELSPPEFPLVAIVFADRAQYVEYARAEVGEGVRGINGHFNLQTNRMVMFDLTGTEARGGRSRIENFLARPDAAQNVATVVHEATHQIAFNCGLQDRFAGVPMWFSEGIAVYFETPDLRSAKGWSTVGAVNRLRLRQFRDYLRRRPADSLSTLLGDDKRFQSVESGPDAYAEAWALTYFLLRRYPSQYLQYLKTMAAKKPMFDDDPATRLRDFKAAFGDDLQKLDAELVRYVVRLR